MKSNEYLLRAKDYLPSELQPILIALDELKVQLASLPVNADNFGLIHGDINVGNFTIDEDGGITLFDFDECQYSWYVEDIAIQLYTCYMYSVKIRNSNERSSMIFL
ncbi:phosphotransferase [Paenibacillus sp. MABNR03]|uniref:phosphotransferase n=1 Tax=Paenibacillus sp. MABNR03 TaxID=3142626 RepID=UPI003D2A592C